MQRANVLIRSFLAADNGSCLALFDQNCPEYFDPGERADYAAFLESRPAGYELCLLDTAGRGVRQCCISPPARSPHRFSPVLGRALSSAFHRAGGHSSIALRWSSIACNNGTRASFPWDP